ncbi:MAG: hypothetical protein QOK05_2007 [Chloroflexota bacterium]|nr:hypothetical protein [Chloroflexota bacterium]
MSTTTEPGLLDQAAQGTGAHLFNEMLSAPGRPRPGYGPLLRRLRRHDPASWKQRHEQAQRAFKSHGITFTVYQGERGIEKIFPFDLLPRVIQAGTWRHLERGLQQRVRALNHFLADIYGDRRILAQNRALHDIVMSSAQFRRELCGFPAARGVHCNVAGIDLVRDERGVFHVLEDNLRTPSGISYVLANRQILKRVFPELFRGYRVRPVESYCHQLLINLRWLAPRVENPTVVILSPGIYNSAYFEHLYLAKQMGVELVEGSDLAVDNDRLFMRTTEGLKQVHVVYRRVDDDYIDPIFGRRDSILGVAGLVNACRAGGVAVANAFGNGVADDKAVYAFVPEMIRYYLGEDAILPNVPTFLCSDEKQRAHVLDHLPEMVVKKVSESGGYGMLIGPAASAEQLETFRRRIISRPRDYIGQPVVPLSVLPAFDGQTLVPRHQDLRPFVLCGDEITVTPGGLTRVALRDGSLVVNSSQGGGSRDTWVLAAQGEEPDDA